MTDSARGGVKGSTLSLSNMEKYGLLIISSNAIHSPELSRNTSTRAQHAAHPSRTVLALLTYVSLNILITRSDDVTDLPDWFSRANA